MGSPPPPTLRRYLIFNPFARSPGREYILEYVEVIQRHHKRTPYASNTFFKESVSWSCDGEGPMYGVRTYVSSISFSPPKPIPNQSKPERPWIRNHTGPGTYLYLKRQNLQKPRLSINNTFDSGKQARTPSTHGHPPLAQGS